MSGTFCPFMSAQCTKDCRLYDITRGCIINAIFNKTAELSEKTEAMNTDIKALKNVILRNNN